MSSWAGNLPDDHSRQRHNYIERLFSSCGHCGAAKGQVETLKILHAHGASLWIRNNRGDLPLHEAVQSGRKDLVRWLLSKRPDIINVSNNDGRCPLHIAAINNNVEMSKVNKKRKKNRSSVSSVNHEGSRIPWLLQPAPIDERISFFVFIDFDWQQSVREPDHAEQQGSPDDAAGRRSVPRISGLCQIHPASRRRARQQDHGQNRATKSTAKVGNCKNCLPLCLSASIKIKHGCLLVSLSYNKGNGSSTSQWLLTVINTPARLG